MSFRSYILALVAAALASCAQKNLGAEPPKDGFYYPVSLAAVETATPGKPYLFVVSTNFDLRYNRGTVIAVDTGKMSEPPDGPVTKAVDPDHGWVFIDSFGGGIATYVPRHPIAPGEVRLFVPSRSQNLLYPLSAGTVTRAVAGGPDVTFPKVSCMPAALESHDCFGLGESILLQDPTNAKIRSVDPFSVVVEGGSVFITHLRQADDPPLSLQNPNVYLVKLDAEDPTVPFFINVGSTAPSQGIATTPAGVYFGGRALTSTDQANSKALRVLPIGACSRADPCAGVSCDTGVCSGGQCQPECAAEEALCSSGCADLLVDPGNCGFCGITCAPAQACRGGLCQPAQTCRADLDCARANEFCTARAVQDVGLTLNTQIDEARGMTPSSDGQRLFVTTRSPDGLLTLDISRDPATGLVRNRVVGFTLLPSGTDEVLAIPRPGKRDLVAVSCTTANAVAFYDDELGDATGLVEGIQEPFGLARTSLAGNPNGARLFVASFGNDTVDVIDIVDLGRARTAALVGHMGFGAHRPLGINLPGTSP